MNISSEILQAVNEIMTYNSGSCVYLSGSTNVSCSCYISYGYNVRYETNLANYEQKYEDLSIIVKKSDVYNWGLLPKVSKLTIYQQIFVNTGSIDTGSYMIGGIMTYTNPYYWISLRSNNAS